MRTPTSAFWRAGSLRCTPVGTNRKTQKARQFLAASASLMTLPLLTPSPSYAARTVNTSRTTERHLCSSMERISRRGGATDGFGMMRSTGCRRTVSAHTGKEGMEVMAMRKIKEANELIAVSVRQGIELAAIEAKVLLGYLEGHDYSLMMDDKFHLALRDNQDGENADNDQPYTIRDCIDFCQEMNSELLLEEAGKEGGDPYYFSELQKDELILGMMMERAKVALPPRTSTYDVVIVEYLKKVVPVEATSWEEAEMLVNEAWDNGTYVLTADDFAGVSFTHGH
nr:MAG TPA_asm: DpnD/PcfM-like protein [Caudoviricetes sp.]